MPRQRSVKVTLRKLPLLLIYGRLRETLDPETQIGPWLQQRHLINKNITFSDP